MSMSPTVPGSIPAADSTAPQSSKSRGSVVDNAQTRLSAQAQAAGQRPGTVKQRLGLTLAEIPRSVNFCSAALLML